MIDTNAKYITIDTSKWSQESGESDPVRDEFKAITDGKNWRKEMLRFMAMPKIEEEISRKFHTHWTEAGRFIREQISDDLALSHFLRKMLPQYQGLPMTLYRGENRERWLQKRIGFCWSSSREVAAEFGRMQNAIENGGVLLVANFIESAIIAGPSEHSLCLEEKEYTVDPFKIFSAKVLEPDPSSS